MGETKGHIEVDDAYLDRAISYREREKKLHNAMRVPGFIYKFNDERGGLFGEPERRRGVAYAHES